MNKLIYKKRAQRIRRKLKNVNKNRFRLSVCRSSRNISAQIIDDKDNNLILGQIKKNETSGAIWGTTRSIVNNAIIGVSVGHEKILELTGVGFRAMLKENLLNLQLGFSRDTQFKIPEGIKINIEKQTIIRIGGIDKELVGKIASEIKSLKPVEPYKGKGIKERNQYVLRKEGKKK